MTDASVARVPNGATAILTATVIAGVAGYGITWLVYRQIGAAPYAVFAAFWAAIYLVVGGLSGVQQEITRATRERGPHSGRWSGRVWIFGASTAVIAFAAVLATAPLWAIPAFPAQGWALVWPLAVGVASYVLVATVSGSLYGVSEWRSLALMIATDGTLRLTLLAVGTSFTQDVIVLAWLVALPFPLTVVLLWPAIRGKVSGRTELDVGYRALSWNVARTVAASAATAVLVSGFPLLIVIAARGQDQAMVGELIFTLTLTRAPLIVTVMSLQSYFVVRFRDRADAVWATLVPVLAVILAAAALLAVLGWLLGPAVFAWVTAASFSLDGWLIAILVASSALIAALCMTGAAVLARSLHLGYSMGWVLAALITVVIMLCPLDFFLRLLLAVLVAPVVGLVVHLGWLLVPRPIRQRGDQTEG